MGDVSLSWQHFLIANCMLFSNSYLSSVPSYSHQIPASHWGVQANGEQRQAALQGSPSFMPAHLPTKEHGGNLPNWEQKRQIQRKELSIKTFISEVFFPVVLFNFNISQGSRYLSLNFQSSEEVRLSKVTQLINGWNWNAGLPVPEAFSLFPTTLLSII